MATDPKHFDFTGGKPAIRREGQTSTTDDRLAKQGKTWAVGMNFAFTVMGGGLIGWLVQRFGMPKAAPWPLLIGLGCGMTVGLLQFIREAMKLNRR